MAGTHDTGRPGSPPRATEGEGLMRVKPCCAILLVTFAWGWIGLGTAQAQVPAPPPPSPDVIPLEVSAEPLVPAPPVPTPSPPGAVTESAPPAIAPTPQRLDYQS